MICTSLARRRVISAWAKREIFISVAFRAREKNVSSGVFRTDVEMKPDLQKDAQG